MRKVKLGAIVALIALGAMFTAAFITDNFEHVVLWGFLAVTAAVLSLAEN